MQLLPDSHPGEQVDRYVHSLQIATRAHRHGADEETVVAALLHDIGDMLAQDNHGELAASFDQNYETLPIDVFEPMVRRIFDREPWGISHEDLSRGPGCRQGAASTLLRMFDGSRSLVDPSGGLARQDFRKKPERRAEDILMFRRPLRRVTPLMTRRAA
jgi:HD domain